MPRKPRFTLPGVPQHIVQRGNNREPCLYSGRDHRRYLEDLQASAERHSRRTHAYVLMTDHVHLLVTTVITKSVAPLQHNLIACLMLAFMVASAVFPASAGAGGWGGENDYDDETGVINIGVDGKRIDERKRGRRQDLTSRPTAKEPALQNGIGNRYRTGSGGVRDYYAAMRWYRMAADQGYAPAQNNIGVMYELGLGVSADPAEAAKWYALAAAQGEDNAQHSLGLLLRDGRGVSMDLFKAAALIRKAAEQGHDGAYVDLARLYWHGTGVPRDRVLFYKWCHIAALRSKKAQLPRCDSAAAAMRREEIDAARVMAESWQPTPETAAASLANPRDTTSWHAKRIIRAYKFLTTYCDHGEVTQQLTRSFSRCYRNDGLYKSEFHAKSYWQNHQIEWADHEKRYGLSGNVKNGKRNVIYYDERPLRYADKNKEMLARIVSVFLPSTWSARRLETALEAFKINRKLSDDRITVLEREEKVAGGKKTYRLWVSNEDHLFRRAESYYGERPLRIVSVSDVRKNESLQTGDLSYTPPLMTRYSLQNRPYVFVPVTGGAAFFLGFALSGARVLRNRGQVARRKPSWRKIWKAYFILLLSVLGGLFVLGLLSLPGGGHPPAIVYIYLLAVFCGLGFLFLGLLLLGAQSASVLGARVYRARIDRTGGNLL